MSLRETSAIRTSRSLNIHNWVLWAMAIQNYIHLFILQNDTKWTEQEGKEDPKILKKKLKDVKCKEVYIVNHAVILCPGRWDCHMCIHNKVISIVCLNCAIMNLKLMSCQRLLLLRCVDLTWSLFSLETLLNMVLVCLRWLYQVTWPNGLPCHVYRPSSLKVQPHQLGANYVTWNTNCKSYWT